MLRANMKAGLVFCLLAAGFAYLQAAPLQNARYGFLSATTLEKGGVGDIWKSCGNPARDHAEIDSVTITPDPPKKGEDVTVIATFTLNKAVTTGSVKVTLKLGFLPLPGKTFDLCELLEDAGESCPVEEGKFSIKLALDIPRATPSGTYKATAVATDQDNDQLLCVEVTLKL